MAEPGPSRKKVGVRLDVEVLRRAERWDFLAVSDAMLEGAARAAFAVAEEHAHAEATIVLADDAEMRVLNRTYGGKDASTNVLSFPGGRVTGAEDPLLLGDIVLAGETVEREAEERGISTADHAAHLVVHGMLHLLGFDHDEDSEAERMERMEVEILAGLGIADPYAERSRPEGVEV